MAAAAVEPIRLRLKKKLRQDEKFTKWMNKIDKDQSESIDIKEFGTLLYKVKERDTKYASTWETLNDNLIMLLFNEVLKFKCDDEEEGGGGVVQVVQQDEGAASRELSYRDLRKWIFPTGTSVGNTVVVPVTSLLPTLEQQEETVEQIRLRMKKKLRQDEKFTKWMNKIDKDQSESIDIKEFGTLLYKVKERDTKYASTWETLNDNLIMLLFNEVLKFKCDDKEEGGDDDEAELPYGALRKWIFPAGFVATTVVTSNAKLESEIKQAIRPPANRAKRTLALHKVIEYSISQHVEESCGKCGGTQKLECSVKNFTKICDEFETSKSYRSTNDFDEVVWKGFFSRNGTFQTLCFGCIHGTTPKAPRKSREELDLAWSEKSKPKKSEDGGCCVIS